MKQKKVFFIVFLLVSVSCVQTDFSTGRSEASTLTLTAEMPGEEPQTRVSLGKDPDSKDIVVKWKAGDKVLLFFQNPDGTVVAGEETTVTIVPDTDSKKAAFPIILPEGVITPYTIYLVHGATAIIAGNKIEVDVSPVGFKKLDELVTPLIGKVEVASGSPTGTIRLQHLGALQCLTLANYRVDLPFTESVELSHTEGDAWFYKAGSKYDLISETVTNDGSGAIPWQEVSVPAAQTELFVQWVMPNENIPPAIVLKAGDFVSPNAKPARSAKLERGRAYHLYGSVNYYHTELKFAEPLVWAGSNIYWDGTKLTFDETVIDRGADSDLKQGVFFRWGSLVGVSPSAAYVTYTPHYVPDGTSTWTTGGTPYRIIPDFYNVDTGTGGQTSSYLNDTDRNTAAMYLSSKGDICKYLSKTDAVEGNWRMPTAAEFNAPGVAFNTPLYWSTHSVPWSAFGAFTSISGTEADGTTIIRNGGTYTVGHTATRFPASGYRIDEEIYEAGVFGSNWSSSTSSVFISTDYAYHMYFFSNLVNTFFFNTRYYGYTVRCVRE